MKKLSRSALKAIKGSRDCAGCPTGDYGPGAGPSRTCEDYAQLPSRCKICVLVSIDCFPN
jgi:hypothetical protein